MNINLEIIFQKPSLDKSVKLVIQPLAPLSMVSDIPGTYYKTQEVPDKYKLCGLFENLLGWHFDKNDRAAITKDLKKFNVKTLKNDKYVSKEANSSFQPLLFDFFETGLVLRHQSVQYNDLWKKAFSRMDADTHAKGTPNLDYEVLKKKHIALKDVPIADFFKENKKNYPMYYTSPTLREYIAYSGVIEIKIDMHVPLFDELQTALLNNSTAYLGNSEGWVEINMIEL
jgi:CRISPR-associated protein Cas5